VAKHRRGRPRPVASRSRRSRPSPARKAKRARPAPPPPTPPPAPVRKSTYLEAVAVYERGVEALQRHTFAAAAERFREVLQRYPEERELHERARLYLRVCERELQREEPTPQTLEERIYAATLALNAGRDEDALRHLTRALTDDAESGNVHYMLAVVHARRGNTEASLSHLRQAVELDPETRGVARRDPDLDSLRGTEAFRQIAEAPAAPPGGRRRTRGRSSR
jgi:Tfp pilus assembly protein PilF